MLFFVNIGCKQKQKKQSWYKQFKEKSGKKVNKIDLYCIFNKHIYIEVVYL